MIKDYIVEHSLLLDISRLDRFLGKWEELERKNYIAKDILLTKSNNEATSSSLRIEGINAKDYEIERLLLGFKINNMKEKDQREAKGYNDALLFIKEDYEVIELDEALLKKLSLSVSGKDSYRRGNKNPKQNILFGEDEIENAPTREIRVLLGTLIEETRKLEREKGMHPVILAGLFLQNFLSINPFESGNGRVSRLLTYYLLLKGGYTFFLYTSFENIIEETRKTYLSSLRRSQENENDNAFLEYFVKTLLKAAIRFDSTLEREREKKQDNRTPEFELSPLEERIVLALAESGHLYTYDLFLKLENVKMPTLKKALGKLTEAGIIIRKGKGRGTYYKSA